MSKAIKITSDLLEQCTKEFIEALRDGKFPDGKITFSKNFENVERKAQLYFEEKAWIKMSRLISDFTTEVGWHGIAKRGDKPDEFIIEDIIVYPQEVTGVTVTPDQEKYQMWLMTQEDEVFENIRMQGHSHVNMSTTPSSVDSNFYESILSQLDDDMFYIFMIWNKRGEKTIKIYDIRENVLFETGDVVVSILQGDLSLETFIKEAKEMVETKKSQTYTGTTYSSYKGYGQQYGSGSGYNGKSSSSGKKDDKSSKQKGKSNNPWKGGNSSATVGYCLDYDDDYNAYESYSSSRYR